MNVNVDLVKKIVSITTQLGTGAISSAIIVNNVPIDNRNLITKITVPVAGFMIGGMAAKNTAAFSDAFVDDCLSVFKTAADITDTEAPEATI